VSTDPEDVLPRIFLTEFASMLWSKAINEALGQMNHKDLTGPYIDSIPDEQAYANDDGTLTIWVRLPGKKVRKVEATIPAEHWWWKS